MDDRRCYPQYIPHKSTFFLGSYLTCAKSFLDAQAQNLGLNGPGFLGPGHSYFGVTGRQPNVQCRSQQPDVSKTW